MLAKALECLTSSAVLQPSNLGRGLLLKFYGFYDYTSSMAGTVT